MKNLVVLIFILLTTGSFAQQPFVLADDYIPGITSINTRFFDNDGLWGYINGGADLYLEYGFEQLTVFDIKAGGIDYKADLYKMVSPEAAFGIYSISRFKCKESAILTAEDCLTPYQYIAAQGEVYISVSNSTGSAEAQQTTIEIARKLLAQIESHAFAKPEVFSRELLAPHTSGLKYITGQLGMQNGFVPWEPLFQEVKNYKAWILPVKQDGNVFNLALVDFSDSTQLNAFLQKNDLKATSGKNQAVGNKVFTLFIKGNKRLVLADGVIPDSLLDFLESFLWHTDDAD
jgi:hypothetical protein